MKEDEKVEAKEIAASLEDFKGFGGNDTVDDSFWDNDEPEELGSTEEEGKPESKPVGEEREIGAEIFDDEEDEIEEESDTEEEEEGNEDEEGDGSSSTGEETDNKTKGKGGRPKKVSKLDMLEALKSTGIVDYELEEGEELTEELAEELIEEGFENSVNSRIKELFDELPDDIKQLNHFVINGGDYREFLQKVSKGNLNTGITEDLDLDQEENQELVMREILKEQGEDPEDIEAQIEFLKDSGKLKGTSKRKYEKWTEKREQEKEALVERQKQQKLENQRKHKEFKNNLSKFVQEADLGDIVLSRKDKKEIASYVADRDVELQNGAKISRRDRDIYEVLNNEKAAIQLAHLLRHRKEDGTFDLSFIEKQVETKVSKKVKENVRRSSGATPNTSVTTEKGKGVELHEFF